MNCCSRRSSQSIVLSGATSGVRRLAASLREGHKHRAPPPNTICADDTGAAELKEVLEEQKPFSLMQLFTNFPEGARSPLNKHVGYGGV